MTIAPELLVRAHHKCELCEGDASLQPFEVPSLAGRDDATIVVCAGCAPQLDPTATLDPSQWYGLQASIWSEHPAVQVMSWRLLHRLAAEPWAHDLLSQAYLAEDVLAWASEGAAEPTDEGTPTLDSNGAQLLEGDAVTLIKDLDVKGTSFVAKRGTLVKNIHLTSNPAHVEGRVNGVVLVLKTEFLKKA